MRPIFCGNFEYDARQSDLERLFGRYGKVDRVDMKSGEFKCSCFITSIFTVISTRIVVNVNSVLWLRIITALRLRVDLGGMQLKVIKFKA